MTDGISNNAIKQLALKGSVGSLSSPVYTTIRAEIVGTIREIAEKVIGLCKMRGSKTINHEDVQMAISVIPYLQYMKLNKRTGTQRNVKSCRSIATNTYGMKDRAKIAKKRIKKSSESSNCFNLPKAAIAKLFSSSTANRKKTKTAMILIQESVETHIITIFDYASRMSEKKIMKDRTVRSAIHLVKNQCGSTDDHHRERLKSYFKRVYSGANVECKMTAEASYQLDIILNLVANKYASTAVKLCRLNKKSTVQSFHVMQASNMFMTGKLKKTCNQEIARYRNMSHDLSKKRLIMPSTRCGRFISKPYSIRTSVPAKIYLTVILEYILCEMVDAASTIANGEKKVTVEPKHLQRGLYGDEELRSFMKHIGYKIPLSGVYRE